MTGWEGQGPAGCRARLPHGGNKSLHGSPLGTWLPPCTLVPDSRQKTGITRIYVRGICLNLEAHLGTSLGISLRIDNGGLESTIDNRLLKFSVVIIDMTME